MSAFDRIIGYEDVKTELIRFCDVLKNYENIRSLEWFCPEGFFCMVIRA